MSKPSQSNPTGSQLPLTNKGICESTILGNVAVKSEPPNYIVANKGLTTPQTSSISRRDHKLGGTINFADFTHNGTETIQAATFESKKALELRTMDNVINLIGIENYKVVMHALQSITDDNLRKSSIAALLTTQHLMKSEVMPAPSKTYRDAATLTDDYGMDLFKNSLKPNIRFRPRIRRRQLPYAVKQEPPVIKVKRIVVDPFECSAEMNRMCRKSNLESPCQSVKDQLDSNSDKDLDNFSSSSYKISKAVSLSSFDITPSIINNHETLALDMVKRFIKTDSDEDGSLDNLTIDESETNRAPQKRMPFNKKNPNKQFPKQVGSSIAPGQKRRNESPKELDQIKRSHLDAGSILSEIEYLGTLNGTVNVMEAEGLGKSMHGLDRLNAVDSIRNWEGISNVTQKNVQGAERQDWFHLATPEELKSLPPERVTTLLRLQMYIDLKLCLEPDEDDKLPIHNAVLTNDMDLLKRQCLVLKARNESIDIGDAKFNYSALQWCVVRGANTELARELLRRGASPLAPDDEERSALHHAAEAASHDYVQLLLEHMAAESRQILQVENLWSPEMEKWKHQQLVDRLFIHALTIVDKNCYTPLMQAARLGHSEHVYFMLEQIMDGILEVVDFQAPNSGNTALYLAVEAACHQAIKTENMSQIADSFSKVIQNLIRYGADPFIENNYGGHLNTLVGEYDIQALRVVINNALNQTKLRDFSTVVDYSLIDRDGNEKNNVLKMPPGDRPFILIKTEDGLIFERSKTFDAPVSYVKRPSNSAKLLPKIIQSQQNESVVSELPSPETKHPTKFVKKARNQLHNLGDTGKKYIGCPKIVESSNTATSEIKTASTVEAKKKPVILQDIQLKNTSDYIKNFKIKNLKVKVLPKNTITAGTDQNPQLTSNPKTLKLPGKVIKISRSSLMAPGAAANLVKTPTQNFVNSFGQSIRMVKSTNQLPVFKIASSLEKITPTDSINTALP